MCVALPFFTRRAFNRKRSCIIICAVFVFNYGCAILRASNLRYVPATNQATNSSRYILSINEAYKTINLYLTLYRNVTLFLEQAIMIISIVVLGVGLRSSRQLVGRSRPKSTVTSGNGYLDTNRSGPSKADRSSTEKKKMKKADNKEFKAVQQCLAIVILHVVYSSPRIVRRSLTIQSSSFVVTGYYIHLANLVFITDCFNAAVQFFIYMKFNQRFRSFVSSKLRPRIGSHS
ncbi:hypothetical protein PoB_006597300 [Plakobranchus ocellatus]|uniref:G-protein coupled receptors family 1 profile domain-containing protein n=1 Tax=Plakobranchus ocellatus TaxID=259542 RepID=A0AAV4D5Q6_9GAST|nr:hypothetical protein PoB_006597300 [Plakobranchus ocellatus]